MSSEITTQSPKDRAEHGLPLLDEERSSQDDLELTELDEAGTTVFHDKFSPNVPQQGISIMFAIAIMAISVLGYTINTESTVYFEDRLGWRKPFATMYITHSSLMLPWLCHTGYLRWRDRRVPLQPWVRNYLRELRESVQTVDAYANRGAGILWKGSGHLASPIGFLWITMSFTTVILTVSGISWFFALALTTPADLTAIYNCSTFFAAVFSVPILKERLSRIGMIAVALSLIGTFVIAYGDTTGDHSESAIGSFRLLGNLIACIGAVAFGLFEVLMKKWASPSTPEAVRSSLPLTLATTALTGFCTMAVLWVGLIVLHVTGVEKFVFPDAYTCLWIVISVLSAALGMTLLILLVVWTDPVFGSLVNVLNVFFIALADWVVWGLSPSFATYAGGVLILVAFGMLSKDSLGGNGH